MQLHKEVVAIDRHEGNLFQKWADVTRTTHYFTATSQILRCQQKLLVAVRIVLNNRSLDIHSELMSSKDWAMPIIAQQSVEGKLDRVLFQHSNFVTIVTNECP